VARSQVNIGPEAPLVKHTHPGEEIIDSLEGPPGIRAKASRRRRSPPVTP
jgi:hypothetical protein